MIIPNSTRRKALIIVDVQSDFLNNSNSYIVDNIVKLVKNTSYDMYIEAVFYTKPNSIWKKQTNYECPKSENTCSVSEIKDCLKELNSVKIEKQTKSIWKWDINVLKLLKNNKIEEVHFVWLETNDCILASVYESFDLWFFSYVIEECCEWPNKELHQSWINVMRRVNLTNKSIIENIDTLKI